MFVADFSYLWIQAQWVLVYWPEEDSVSIVKDSSIVPPVSELGKGDECEVKIGKKRFAGKFVDKGECHSVYTDV